MNELVAREVVVHGTVQGVGFRWYASATAERLGVRGWIRNEYDGSVRAHIEGTIGQVEGMIAWLRHGPQWARVTRVDIAAINPTGLASFDVRG